MSIKSMKIDNNVKFYLFLPVYRLTLILLDIARRVTMADKISAIVLGGRV